MKEQEAYCPTLRNSKQYLDWIFNLALCQSGEACGGQVVLGSWDPGWAA